MAKQSTASIVNKQNSFIMSKVKRWCNSSWLLSTNLNFNLNATIVVNRKLKPIKIWMKYIAKWWMKTLRIFSMILCLHPLNKFTLNNLIFEIFYFKPNNPWNWLSYDKYFRNISFYLISTISFFFIYNWFISIILVFFVRTFSNRKEHRLYGSKNFPIYGYFQITAIQICKFELILRVYV